MQQQTPAKSSRPSGGRIPVSPAATEVSFDQSDLETRLAMVDPGPYWWRVCDDCLRPSRTVLDDCTNYSELTLPPVVKKYGQEEREQTLRDYKVTIEYKHLKSHAPGGVYLVPSLGDLRLFFGVIFVRRGPFTNGIFKFQLQLPPTYNDVNQHPKIIFSSYVYNPHVDVESGELDIKTAYPKSDPSRHYLVTVLTFLKKIFYAKSFDDAKANEEAKIQSQTDPSEYRKKVDDCVGQSQKKAFANNDGSTAKFTEEILGHRVLRDLLKANVREPAHVSKQAVLSMIDKASKV